MNKVILMGRLVRDPEMRQTPSGVSVCRFTIAVNRRFKNKDTGMYDADFISCQAWRQTAEFIGKHFRKGSMIAAVGSIQTGSYEKDGAKHYTTDVVVDEAYFTGGRNENGGGNNYGNEPAPGDDFASAGFITDGSESEDDLPF